MGYAHRLILLACCLLSVGFLMAADPRTPPPRNGEVGPAAPTASPDKKPASDAISTEKSDGTKLVGTVAAWDANGFKLIGPDGKTETIGWKELKLVDVLGVFTQSLAITGTGRQWLAAGHVLAAIDGGGAQAQVAFAKALKLDKTLEIEVNDALESLFPPPDPASRTGGATTATAPECSNIVNLEQVGPDHFRFQCNSKIKYLTPLMAQLSAAKAMPDPHTAHGWGHFCLRLDQTEPKPITLDVRAWDARNGLRLLYTYEDPDTPAAFQSKDGQEPWQELAAAGLVDRAGATTAPGGFDLRVRFVLKPKRSPVWVASSYPFTYKYYLDTIARIQKVAETTPSINVKQVAKTAAGRPVFIVSIGESGGPHAMTKPTVLIYAAEHSTEPVSSHVAAAALDFLTSDSPEANEVREKTAFIIMPMIDPDGACDGLFDHITFEFLPQTTNPVAYALADYIGKRYDPNNRLDLVFSLLSSSGIDLPDLQPAKVRRKKEPVWQAFQGYLKPAIAPLTLGAKCSSMGYDLARFAGWCDIFFGPTAMYYEINERNSLKSIAIIGQGMARSCCDMLSSPIGDALAKHAREWRRARVKAIIHAHAEHPFAQTAPRLLIEYNFMEDLLKQPATVTTAPDDSHAADHKNEVKVARLAGTGGDADRFALQCFLLTYHLRKGDEAKFKLALGAAKAEAEKLGTAEPDYKGTDCSLRIAAALIRGGDRAMWKDVADQPWFPYQADRSPVCRALIDAGQFTAALEFAAKVDNARTFARDHLYTLIACGQIQAGRFDDAKRTIALMLPCNRHQAMFSLLRALRMKGDKAALRKTLEEAEAVFWQKGIEGALGIEGACRLAAEWDWLGDETRFASAMKAAEELARKQEFRPPDPRERVEERTAYADYCTWRDVAEARAEMGDLEGTRLAISRVRDENHIVGLIIHSDVLVALAGRGDLDKAQAELKILEEAHHITTDVYCDLAVAVKRKGEQKGYEGYILKALEIANNSRDFWESHIGQVGAWELQKIAYAQLTAGDWRGARKTLDSPLVQGRWSQSWAGIARQWAASGELAGLRDWIATLPEAKGRTFVNLAADEGVAGIVDHELDSYIPAGAYEEDRRGRQPIEPTTRPDTKATSAAPPATQPAAKPAPPAA